MSKHPIGTAFEDIRAGDQLEVDLATGQIRRLRPDEDAGSDPRKLGGDIVGPGGPYDRDSVLIDVTNSVLLQSVTTSLVGLGRLGDENMEEAIAILMEGKVNKSSDYAKVLFVTNVEGSAQLIANLFSLASRGGFYGLLGDQIKNQIEEMPT